MKEITEFQMIARQISKRIIQSQKGCFTNASYNLILDDQDWEYLEEEWYDFIMDEIESIGVRGNHKGVYYTIVNHLNAGNIELHGICVNDLVRDITYGINHPITK